MNRPRVLLVGLASSAVDYDKWPDLSVEKLEAAFEQVASEAASAGFDARWCLTDTSETAPQQLKQDLLDYSPDIVLIGAGVRTDPDLLLLFERMINVISHVCPASKIAFNSSPFDTIEAIQRWAR
ncbi:hypothetical protein [Algisphaera agarilytica]|uniref:DNA-binding LacI/PurR family transcriptional regulator n=1 Tax=Algisphaera agarilytica TaxID=1385975 RepID=A0A7X0H5S5_9BACT|nr:hypothetical protein [Algisphaera agarilytica]MBB6429770.1 DNA-binding LacI/PurR family transcriptional regulator [Algisphaera agarilytica]